MSELGGPEIFTPGEGGSSASEGLSEQAKQRFAASAAAAKASQKDERKAKKRDDKVAQAIIPSYVKASAKQATWMNQVSELAIQMLWKGLSKEDELDADRLGVEYARASGYNAQSFKEVLEMLKARAQDAGTSKDLKFLLSTHPKPEDRIGTVAGKIKSFPQGGQRLKERFEKQAKI